MRTIDGRVHADGPVNLASRIRVREDLRVDPIPRPVPTEPTMTLPRGLPRTELGWQIPPRRTRPIPPDDPLKHPTVLLERPTTLDRRGRHQRLNPSPRDRKSTRLNSSHQSATRMPLS